MITSTRIIEFDSGHRVIGHEGKCKYLHGHRYKLEITLQGNELDSLGRVVDFGIIKDVIGNWINKNFDHTTILSIKDKQLGDEIEKITKQKIYYLNSNPTSENISAYLFSEIIPELLKKNKIEAECTQVKLYETPNCYSCFSK